MATVQDFTAEAPQDETISTEAALQPVQEELKHNDRHIHTTINTYCASKQSSKIQQLPFTNTPISTLSLPVAAAEAVLSNPALLERVLLSIDFYHLLHSQRVNKTFRNTILGSRPLRRQLWLFPPRRLEQLYQPSFNHLLLHFHANLAIKRWIRRVRGEAFDVVLRFASRAELKKLRWGTWREMVVFKPNGLALGRLTVQIETDDTPCVYEILPVRILWDQTVRMGDLVDMAIPRVSA